jgi:osmotically-inducible protein OsmY
MKDTTLTDEVERELASDPMVNEGHIGVTANAGVITLAGYVASYAERAGGSERCRARVRSVGR